MAVIKAEAYGHGASSVAKLAQAEGIAWFGVALPEEGIALRQAGVDGNILVVCSLLTGASAGFLRLRSGRDHYQRGKCGRPFPRDDPSGPKVAGPY